MFPSFIHIFLYSTDNLSLFYIFSIFVSFVVVLITIIITYLKNKEKINKNNESEEKNNLLTSNKNGLQAKYKLARQKILKKQFVPEHCEEEEEKVELQTLQTVMQLLKKQCGTSAPTMNELRQQLNLYRSQ